MRKIISLQFSYNDTRTTFNTIFKKIVLLIILFPFSIISKSQTSPVDFNNVTWEHVEDNQARCFTTNSKGRIFAGLWEICGVIYSDDNGSNWNFVKVPNSSICVQSIAITSDDILYLTSYDGKLYQSSDDGFSWFQLFKDSVDIKFTDIAVNSKDIVFLGSHNGLYYISTEGSLTKTNWENWINNWANNIQLVSINKNDEIFITADNIFRSVDNGNNWMIASTGITNWGLNEIVFNSTGVIYAGGAGPNGALFESTNNGELWESTSYAFKEPRDSVITSIACSGSDEIFFGTFGKGIKVLGPDGNVKTLYSPTTEQIFSIYFAPDGHLIAGTQVGTFKSSQLLSSVENINTAFYVEQNFPNPFNSLTKIRYSISSESDVVLTIYDTLGRVVKVLVKEKQPPGKYSVLFNAYNEPSGMYLYKFEADNQIVIKNMMHISSR